MSPNATTSPALHAASIFLTRPLTLLGVVSPSTILALQLFLHSALSSACSSSSQRPLLLSLTPTSLPPLPIQLTCVAFGIKWSAWIRALGGTAFDLVVEPARVYVVKKATGQVGVIWVGEDVRMDIMDMDMDRATGVPQVSLDAESDAESESDAPGSRPSSRSSSHSSTSSTSSSSVFSSSTSLSSASTSTSPSSHTKIAITKPAFTPAPTPTKYLYQGGLSTVLTGGVMLGAPVRASASVPATVHAPAPVPAVRVYTPPHRARLAAAADANAGSWRRRGSASVRVGA